VPELHVLRVFCGEDGRAGNPLGVFLEGGDVPGPRRQEVARRLGFSETVFVDDPKRGRIAIFTPGAELDFAGHPTVGTAWLLASEGTPVDVLRPPAGEVPARADEDGAYVAGRPEWGPPFELAQLGSAKEVEALEGPPRGHDLICAWAWIDEDAGLVRSRVFVDRMGIPEDEATGSAATKLAANAGRPIDIRQGRGSRILARPLGDPTRRGAGGMVEIGGRVVLDEVRTEPA
jgi:predicted PhzF superfamily epimerase YddE/YHI9